MTSSSPSPPTLPTGHVYSGTPTFRTHESDTFPPVFRSVFNENAGTLTPATLPAVKKTNRTTKLERRPSFSPMHNLIIVREVSAAKAHLVPFGEAHKRFSTAAVRANENPNLSAKVTSKRLQDRYKNLIEAFEKCDTGERVMSGVGCEVGHIQDLMGAMVDTQKDLNATKTCERIRIE